MFLPAELPETFLAKVDIRGENDCWLWTGSKLATGYGRYRYGGADSSGGRVWNAHTFCFRVTTGDHSEDRVIDHLCNVRSCVNPRHLEQVTQQENLRRIYGR